MISHYFIDVNFRILKNWKKFREALCKFLGTGDLVGGQNNRGWGSDK